ncbi:MAG: selenocysteine-specific translation elongation factor [Caldisericia bacterium]
MESKRRSFIVGTAGHVDHGKSELIHRITNVDPDRLPEEKERSMTIVLGFAPLDLPSRKRCGVVDVPGHEKLVKRMLVGAVGFDLVLFVIACDEGPQKQTEEHLDILNYLGIKNGIIVLNKADLPHDNEKLMRDIDNLLKGTTLEGSPVVKVSSITGEGIDKLLETIDATLDKTTPKPIDMPVFMPIDRKFFVKGIGLIVGGTLWQGELKIGDKVEIFPSGKQFKIKSLESFEEELQSADAGNRYALRFQGIEKDDIETGNILISPNRFKKYSIFDAKIKLSTKLKKYTRLKIHIDTLEQEVDIIRIGEDFIRVNLETPLPVTRGARFILRKIAPNDTIGGGIVLNPDPKTKPNSPDTLEYLNLISSSTDEGYLDGFISESRNDFLKTNELRLKVNWSDKRFDDFISNGKYYKVEDLIISKEIFDESSKNLSKEISNYFIENKNIVVLPINEAKEKFLPEASTKLFAQILNTAITKPLIIDGSKIVDSSKQVKRSPVEEKLEKMFLLDLFSPPKLAQIKSAKVFSGQEKELNHAISNFITNRVIFKATSEIYFHKKSIIKGFMIMKSIIEKNKAAKLADFRDKANTSRKYAQAFLELLDALGLTRRQGDVRVLGPKAVDLK